MDSLATFIINNKNYIIYSNSQTDAGLWTKGTLIMKLELDIEKHLLIEKLIEALNASKKDVPHPTDWKKVKEEFLQMINEKSLKNLYKHAKNIVVSRNKKEITLLPTKNVGGKGRFDFLNDFEIKIPVVCSNEELYDALQRALNKCE